MRNFQPLAIFCTVRFVLDLVGNPEDRFSQNEAQFTGSVFHRRVNSMLLLDTSCYGSDSPSSLESRVDPTFVDIFELEYFWVGLASVNTFDVEYP